MGELVGGWAGWWAGRWVVWVVGWVKLGGRRSPQGGFVAVAASYSIMQWHHASALQAKPHIASL